MAGAKVAEIPKVQPPPAQKRKRRRGGLADLESNWADERYAEETLTHSGGSFKQRYDVMTMPTTVKKASRAASLYWQTYFDIDDDGEMNERDDVHHQPLGEGMAASRRSAIAYFYTHVYGSAPEHDWDGRGGVVARIRERIGAPEDSARLVRKVMEDVKKAGETGAEYDPHSGCRQRRYGHTKIKDRTAESAIVHTGAEAGIGITEITVLVNEYREEKGDSSGGPVSWSAVQAYIARAKTIKVNRRKTKKSGKEDKGSVWAKARLAQAGQLKEQLRRGKEEDVDHPDDGLFALHLHGIAWWDEFHMKVKLGHASKWEIRLSRHPDTGDICEEEKGGVFAPEMPNTSVKYPAEARVCAGVCMVEDEDGNQEGKTLDLFDYTGKTVVGLKAWKKAEEAELARVKPLGMVWGKEGAGYEERWPETWKEELGKKLRGNPLRPGIVPITDVSDAPSLPLVNK